MLFKLRWVPVAVFVITMIEVMLLVRVGRVLGPLLLLCWLAAAATIGVVLLRSAATARPIGGPRQRGPIQKTAGGNTAGQKTVGTVAEQVADRAVLSGAAVLLIIPGFLSDLVAVLLLIPGNRRALVSMLTSRFAGTLAANWAANWAANSGGTDRSAIDDTGQGPASVRRAGVGDAVPGGDVIEGEFTRRDDER